ncbi:carbamate kinase [Enterococcus plantarum]|uniref:Carbamate kinase n=1 Tax=Enterococcus plantarum TaxID=1077675 RepID=A0A2W3YS90_9ENTE|nr:carbamate kinase [Enterococcus plantarum]MBO0422544.1 carbamate kinase [Enterococcus plantarum]MBO0466193.1 carbamate kinase [Enterococcus plantarum]OEG08924.1 carbamate kinase [Enterococcus plantarum]PZL70471.1 carbamate kinase [Enterococcus plantarum]
MANRVVIALGGNAILKPNQEATLEVQLDNVKLSAELVAKIEEIDYEIVLTHGNGPQVGNILRQNEEAKDVVPPFPLDVCNAESQGFIGYMLEQSLKNSLETKGLTSNVITLLTQTEVSAEDEAFNNPNKPIGIFYTEEEAKQMEQEKNWVMMEDAGRGYRRVVPSPQPKAIHGVDAIVNLLNRNTIVIAGGGGGIPVVRDQNGLLKGIEAVIDKDRTGKKLAEQIDANVFMMLTDVSNVYINYGKENQEKLETISVKQAQQYMDEGHFADGSMGPKMEAAIGFASQGKTAIICSLEDADQALLGRAGTRIVG